ncbi:uncharacterized protein EDB93DRAFT_1146642 [Suillus bovinus]|uniref:uncharacterized protein n=1 Tax=Suillus bovinus TaxID=48563 RepID=UPI001B87B3EA|nr:uncharacterized protein EDB93DRAFT_1146642 [Suillus bovinus]KAG2147777.1 hypothetical protein EDB93DRAFT_1146642 [Suillus bovinus]
MGRPRLYHTLKEQAEAAPVYRHNYYQKNREEFRLKNRERYRRRKRRSQDQVNGDSEGINAEISTSESPLKNDANTGIPNGPQKRQRYISPTSRIESHLITFLGGLDVVIYDYLDTVSLTLLGRTDNTIDTEDICASISKLQRLEKDAHKKEAGILQFYGVGPKLAQAEVTSKKVHHLLSALEEVFIHSLSGVDELAVMYDQADLLFQSW